MRIGKVLGNVTLSEVHPSLVGASLKLVRPLSFDELDGSKGRENSDVVAYDELGAREGCLIAISEGREAAMPFYPEVKPVCAYNAAILDHLEYDKKKSK